MRVFAATFTVIFLLFTAVQYNDPDPQVWIPIYGYAAVVSGLMYFKIINWPMILAGLVFYLAGACYLFSPEIMTDWYAEEMANTTTAMKTTLMEEGREFWGLVICMVVMTIYFFHAVNKNKLRIR